MESRFRLLTTRKGAALFTSCATLSLLATGAAPDNGEPPIPLKIAKIYWEYNASANDLGVHVSLDGEDWKKLKIENPSDRVIFEVKGQRAYAELGMTELFFEGAEPSLDDVALEELLEDFPEGEYEISGRDVNGEDIESEVQFSHAIPDGPDVDAEFGPGDFLKISWTEVTSPPPGFPAKTISIVGYQVIVEPSFQVTLPATARSVTVSPEFVQMLPAGVNKFEVLAIEASGNQTLTEGEFTK